MNRKEGIKTISLKIWEIEMLKYSIHAKIMELLNRIESFHEDENIIEMLESEIKLYSDLYSKLDEALL